MHITLVKKVLADGQPCAKCRQIEQRLASAGYLGRIDSIVIADARDPHSPGIVQAKRLKISQAPFFVVRSTDDESEVVERVYTVYFKFVKEIFGPEQLSLG